MAAIVWVQNDLRLQDNPALMRAKKLNLPVLPVYVLEEGIGAASKWWLHHSLESFAGDLRGIGLSLFLQKGDAAEVLEKLIKKMKASHLLWNRSYGPLEKRVEKLGKKMGCEVECFPGGLLFEPGQVLSGAGKPYTVFTPFWKRCLQEKVPLPMGAPGKMKGVRLKGGLRLEQLRLLPKVGWDKEFDWEPGEKGAWKRLRGFDASRYGKERDFPGVEGTSRLSPHLHFGEVSPRQVWHAVDSKPFLRELGWREFAHHALYFFPKMARHSFRKEFKGFPWKTDRRLLKAWQQGRTGVPIVDAGMRQLWRTGWMHNRVRMIVASFLVKDLWIPWQEGAKWFWDTLVDADLANNTLGWQWCAGCGADAAPFFRIFNPYTQSKKFDPKGDYIRRFVPELADVPTKWIHEPHLAPEKGDYPLPIVDHEAARKRALKVYKSRKR